MVSRLCDITILMTTNRISPVPMENLVKKDTRKSAGWRHLHLLTSQFDGRNESSPKRNVMRKNGRVKPNVVFVKVLLWYYSSRTQLFKVVLLVLYGRQLTHSLDKSRITKNTLSALSTSSSRHSCSSRGTNACQAEHRTLFRKSSGI